jgi:hypothetical protein
VRARGREAQSLVFVPDKRARVNMGATGFPDTVIVRGRLVEHPGWPWVPGRCRCEYDTDEVLFLPGPWERWFGTNRLTPSECGAEWFACEADDGGTWQFSAHELVEVRRPMRTPGGRSAGCCRSDEALLRH